MHDVRLLVTEESGRLTRWLRLMGYDTACVPTQPVSALYRKAYNESRVVITRNRRVKASCLFRVMHLESQTLTDQLRQLIRELGLQVDDASTFTRCDVCNCKLEPIEKSMIKQQVPPFVFQTQQQFHVCPSCHRIYWAATHWQRAQRFFAQLRMESSHA